MITKATLRDGSVIEIGDEVETNFHPKCRGISFVVESMISHPGHCESGVLVLVHAKQDPSRKILGFKKEGFEWPEGIDANWFKKITE